LALNLHIQDYYDQDKGKGTINFETFSVRADLSDLHNQHLNWSGVYIGRRWLELCLRTEGVVIKSAYQHNAKVKPGNMWLICEKISNDLTSKTNPSKFYSVALVKVYQTQQNARLIATVCQFGS
jgi:hypothetical protein